MRIPYLTYETTNIEPAPLISIIVAVYNGSKTLQRCIDSVTCQIYPNKQLIIIDGGSKDETVSVLMANEKHISYWISEQDNGIYSAWNKGLVHALGDWICFLGADDFIFDELVLARMSEQLQKLPPSIRVAYGQVMLLNSSGENIYPHGKPWYQTKSRFKQVMCIPHPGAMHRHDLFEQYGHFNETFCIAGDYEFLLRELKIKEAFFIPGIITVAMQQGGVSSNPINALLSLYEARRAQRMHGQRLPGCLWLMAIVRVYMRLLLWRVLGEQLAREALDLGRRIMGLSPFWTKL